MDLPRLQFIPWQDGYCRYLGSKGYWAIIFPAIEGNPYVAEPKPFSVMIHEVYGGFNVDCPICGNPHDFSGTIDGKTKAQLRNACVAHWKEKHQ